jgi:hypothetical protein
MQDPASLISGRGLGLTPGNVSLLWAAESGDIIPILMSVTLLSRGNFYKQAPGPGHGVGLLVISC